MIRPNVRSKSALFRRMSLMMEIRALLEHLAWSQRNGSIAGLPCFCDHGSYQLNGFLFPFHKFLPSHVIGINSLITLAIAIGALPPPSHGRVALDLSSKRCDQLVSERVRSCCPAIPENTRTETVGPNTV
jgi:hypothetical protein